MRRLIGLTFLALGVIAGIVLLLAPFGKAPLVAGPLMWFTFPLGCVIGHVSLMVGASRAEMALHSTIVGGTPCEENAGDAIADLESRNGVADRDHLAGPPSDNGMPPATVYSGS